MFNEAKQLEISLETQENPKFTLDLTEILILFSFASNLISNVANQRGLDRC